MKQSSLLIIILFIFLFGNVFSQKNTKPFLPLYKGIFTSAAKLIPTAFTPDAPIAGNGDVGIVLGGTPDKLSIYINKSDCWKAKPGYPDGGFCLPGGLNINIPELEGASFYAEQVLANGNINALFKKNDITCSLKIIVAATSNTVIIEISSTGKACNVSMKVWVQTGFDSRNENGKQNGVIYAARHFDSPELDWPSHVAIAVNAIGGKGDAFVLEPLKKAIIVAGICSNFENNDYLATAISRVKNATEKSVDVLKKSNDAWWQQFWSKSHINIGDSLLEKYYYGSQYLLACCSRNKNFAPGLCGNSITADALSAWQGDYHTNYNYEAPWWGCYSSNHIELTEPYDKPVLDYMPKGMSNAQKLLHCGGVYYPVGLGPKGFSTTMYPLDEKKMMKSYGIKDVGLEGGEMFCGQRSNAVFLTTNMFQRFYHTYDKIYAAKVYPFIKAVADFWGDYLKFENGQYNSYNDNFWEVGPWTPNWRVDMKSGDTNNTATLGLLKMFYKGIIDMSTFLNTDKDKIEKWKYISDHLYPLPQVKRNGIIRLKATERGTGPGSEKRTPPGFGRLMAYTWVFPAGIAGVRTQPAFTEILKKEVGRWDTDPGGDPAWDNLGNGFETYFTSAIRVGYDPELVIKKLKERFAKKGMANLWIPQSGGLTETLSAVPSCINEMLLQGYEGIIRVFPAWPAGKDAGFEKLRTYGAFIVSAEKKGGAVRYIKIVSEKGRACVVENPWNKNMLISSNGKTVKPTINGDQYSFATKAGASYMITVK
jgi:hypothetical protein